MKFRKKPVVIEAIKFTKIIAESFPSDEGYNPISVQIEGFPGTFFQWNHFVKQLSIETLEGVMRVAIGDWIIKGIKGEFYPCKSDIFEATYEILE